MVLVGRLRRNAITRGNLDSEQVLAFLSLHAVRDPGVCLNEIAIVLADKGEALVTVLVKPETDVSAPRSVIVSRSTVPSSYR